MKEQNKMKMTVVKHRDGDTLVKVTVETQPATIDFADILAATRLEPDDSSDAPWDNDDGFKHDTVRDNTEGRSAGSYSTRHGWGKAMRVVLENPEGWGNYGYYRKHGASRQVAFEMTRQEWKRTTEQLAKWHDQGWEAWGIICNYEGCKESCWGFYGEADDAYIKESMKDIAGEVASQLEQDGYTVINQPDTRKEYLAGRRAGMQYKLNSQNWK